MSNHTPEKQDTERIPGVASPEAPEAASAVQDTREKVQDVTKLETRPAPWAFYLTTIAALFFSTAKIADCAYSAAKSPDSRSAEEVVRSYLTWRSKMGKEAKENVGEVTDEKVEHIAANALCQMEKMQFVPSEEPKEPKPPVLKKGASVKDKAKYEWEKRNFPTDQKSYAQRRELWKYNNEHRGDHVYVAGLNPADFFTPHILAPDDDEQKKQAARFDYHKNTQNYFLRLRRKQHEQKLRDLMNDERHFKYQYGWLKQGFEAYKKENPAPKDKSTEEWSAKLLSDYVGQAYLDQPLTPVYNCDGKPAQTKDKITCLLVKPAADALTRANRRLCDDKKKEIDFDICFRTNLYDSVTFVANNGEGCGLEGARVGVTLPGTSAHEAGDAADIRNWSEVEPYLTVEAGWFCNLKKDLGHCSATEFDIGPLLYVEMVDAYRKVLGDDVVKGLKDAWDLIRGR